MASPVRPVSDMASLWKVMCTLPPWISILIRGRHGIGKTQMAYALGEHLKLPTVDRRIAQMTEGDIIGLPKITDDVTQFLPVVWFKMCSEKPGVMLLDEFNRATPEVMNACFQIVLDRELNGLKLHPDTRVICCVNDAAQYAVNEMDHALLDRFWVTDVEPTVADWLAWAQSKGQIDPVIVDFIRENPDHLWVLDDLEPGGIYPSPRSWERADKTLKYAKLVPSEWAGGKSAPEMVHPLMKGLVGNGASIAFNDFAVKYNRMITVEDLIDNYDKKREVIRAMSHDSMVGLLDKLGKHCKENNWTAVQMDNVKKWACETLTGEDVMILFTRITQANNMANLRLMQSSGLTLHITEEVTKAQALQASANKTKKS